jgi:hypothetical protein
MRVRSEYINARMIDSYSFWETTSRYPDAEKNRQLLKQFRNAYLMVKGVLMVSVIVGAEEQIRRAMNPLHVATTPI